ncbi:MAG: FtsW/RodA/SpoVE family cell cycle protein [Ignavibacteria bacterium]
MIRKLALIIFFVAFTFLLFGLIVVMSASSTYSAFKFDDLFHLFNSHFVKVIIAICFMIGFCFIPYEIYRESSKVLIFIITFVLILTLFIAENIKGAGRWIDLWIFSFQPADPARLILIFHLASLLEDKGEGIKDFKEGYIYTFIWVIIISGLILAQPNISSGVIIVLISLTILYVGGAKLKHIFISSAFSLIGGCAAAMLFNHSRSRLFNFIDSILNNGEFNIQVKQAMIGLGSGGVFGVGMGHSRQANLFLPEAYGDFIFAVIGEELGFIGSIVILSGYLILFIAGILIAKKAKDKFGQYLAFGITFAITIYAFLNTAVSVGLIPTTGIPLPFISYGGTSLIFLGISIGILVNIAISSAMFQSSVNRYSVSQNFVKYGKAPLSDEAGIG